ncbi:MAG: hypothetical protein C5B51_16485 [Terriglobia bacterium]|nr:MAG: hypothetical protein C5B51_16485 [Terriglobia bacterium]
MRRKLAILILAASAIPGTMVWARRAGEPLKPGVNLFSKQQDMQLGQEAAQEVRQKYQVVQSQFLQDYIRRVGDRLAATPEARQSGFPFTFTMLNVAQVNAFALPGGPMFIFTGLIKSTDNEAQLAGVMAHEMSHVILRHGTHEATKAQGVQLLAGLAGAVAGNESMMGRLANLGLGLGANSFILHFSRQAESEADALGSHLMSEAGYNPIEMAHFFEKLAGTGSQGIQFFSDHPNPGNRERAIEDEIRGLPRREYGYETHDFARAKSEVAALPAPAAGDRGAISPVPGGVAPAGNWQQLDRPTYRVAYPGNWKAYGDSASPNLTIAPAGGLVSASNGTAQMVYGMMLGYYRPRGATNLGTATLDLVAHLHEQDATLQLASADQRDIRIDGSNGLIQTLQSRLPSGEPQTNALVTVDRPQGLFYAVCVAPQRTFQQFANTCQQMLNSVRFGQ